MAAHSPTLTPSGPSAREQLFAALAQSYPTHRIAESFLLRSLWRMAFYAFRPRRPFAMRTSHYAVLVKPERTHLTRKLVRRGCWERFETEVMVGHLKPGMTVVDAGANFGHYTMVAGRHVGPGGRVIAFEPHPSLHADLMANIRLNGLENVEAINGALGAKEGTLDLVIDGGNPGGHSLIPEAVLVEGGRVSTPVHRLDDFMAGRPRPVGLIKMDTQGAEGLIIEGGKTVLAEDRPVVLMEYWPEMLAKSGYEPVDFLRQFTDLGYGIETLLGDRKQAASPEDVLRLSRERGSYVDLLMTPARP